jgi:hypothetical protein
MDAVLDTLKAYLPPGQGYLPYYMFGVGKLSYFAPFRCPASTSNPSTPAALELYINKRNGFSSL